MDIVWDLTKLPWPVPDRSFAEVRSHEFIEHLPHREEGAGEDLLFRVFDEFYRVLAPGGILRLDVPHAASRNAEAFGDVTHRRFFHELAFSVFWDATRDPGYRRCIWELVGIMVRCTWHFGPVNEWHLQEHAPSLFGPRETGGPGLWRPEARAMRWLRRVGPSTPYRILLTLRRPLEPPPPKT